MNAILDEISDTFTRATALSGERRFAEAIPLYERVLALQPAFAAAYNDVGVALYHTGNVARAAQAYQTAMFLDPFAPLAYSNYGVVLNAQDRHGEALAYFSRAAALDPDCAEAFINLGDSYVRLSMFNEAEKALIRALEINPTRSDALVNMGTIQWGLRRGRAAMDCFQRALATHPDHAAVRKNIGLLKLFLGDYSGWADTDQRFKADRIWDRAEYKRWDGSRVGKLGIYSEQGLGDQILHLSILGDVEADTIVCEANPKLVPLLRRAFPEMTFVPYGDPMPECDAYVNMASLGGFYRQTADAIPGSPYLLADINKTSDWLDRLPNENTTTHVGVSWASAGSSFGPSKFVALPNWEPVFNTPGHCFVDLQYGANEVDRGTAPLLHFPDLDPTNNLDNLAAMIRACDLVITISNTTAHLAAALGAETWVLVPAGYGRFWYWGESGERTRWYNSVRLFRQELGEPWSAVMERVAEALRARVL